MLIRQTEGLEFMGVHQPILSKSYCLFIVVGRPQKMQMEPLLYDDNPRPHGSYPWRNIPVLCCLRSYKNAIQKLPRFYKYFIKTEARKEPAQPNLDKVR